MGFPEIAVVVEVDAIAIDAMRIGMGHGVDVNGKVRP